jgi:hypothetical protein
MDAMTARCACGQGELADEGQAMQARVGNGRPTESYPVRHPGANTSQATAVTNPLGEYKV